MNNLLRKVSKKKWTDNASLSRQDYSADSITGCIRTSHNTLSLWKSNTRDFSDVHVEELVVALATTTQRPDVMDVLWFNKVELEELGLEIQDSEGKTPYQSVNERHCDIINMNYQKLGEVGEYLVRRINDEDNVKRFSKKNVFTLVKQRVDSGDVDIRTLSDKWKTAIDPETYPPQTET